LANSRSVAAVDHSLTAVKTSWLYWSISPSRPVSATIPATDPSERCGRKGWYCTYLQQKDDWFAEQFCVCI